MWGFRRVANGQVSSEKKAKSIRRMRRSQGPPPTNGGEHMGRAKKQAEKDDRTHPRPLSDANKNRKRYPNAMLWTEQAKSLTRVNS